LKNQHLSIILSDVVGAVASVGAVKPEGALTPDYIAAYTRMRYMIDYGIPASRSWNARFGRFLKRHATVLGIREVRAKQRYRADDGGNTTCSAWK
jgi:hypothetical protein